MIDEHALIEQWKRGGVNGNRAFQALYEKYNGKIRRDAKRLGGDPDDTSQDVWLRLTETVQAGEELYGSMEAYLFRLTQKALDRDDPSASEPESVSLDAVPDTDLPYAASTEEVVETAELSAIVDRVVESMPRDIRDAWAHKRRGDTDEFAAQQLGVSERTYRTRVASARDIIREALAKAA